MILKQVVNDNGTPENVSANGILCQAILESARRAAQLVGTRLAGVDVICRDASVPLECSGGAVIEVNANPGLYYHYRAAEAAFPITQEFLRRYFNAPTPPCHEQGQFGSALVGPAQDVH